MRRTSAKRNARRRHSTCVSRLAVEALEGRMMLSGHPLTSIPVLNSLPSATAQLYLDFNGHFEPVWSNFTNITTPVYSIDGDYTTFSDEELAEIYSMWARVAEDFAPFNINVTTVGPAVLAEGQPTAAANGIALRVAIGGSTMDWFGQVGVTGVGNINAFTNSNANTVYVFSNNGTTSPLGDVVSHEAGHGFGLQHHQSSEPPDLHWSSIMSGEEETASIWTIGINVLGQPQDDMAVIAGTLNGFGYRPDDHGNTISSATPLSFDGDTYSGAGFIGTNDDIDVWSFSIDAADSYRIALDPAAIGPNLDAVLELRDFAGTLIASASPAATLGAQLALDLLPGSYFLSVAKTATYGLVGTYSIALSAPPAGITITAANTLITKETGATAAFEVVLDSQPSAEVSVSIASSNTAEGSVSSESLVFAPANWNVPQMVTVTGVADAVPDGDTSFSIVVGPSTSADPEYSGIDAPDLAAINIENIYSGFIYFTDNNGDVIQRSRLDGSGVETVLDLDQLYGDGSYSPRGVSVDLVGGQMYWTETGRIQRANLDGSNVETLVSGFTGSGLRGGVALDVPGGKMYWTDAHARKIQRANLDGSGVQDLITGPSLSGARDLVLDLSAGKMYWPDFEENNIRRANLDGSNIEVLWTGVEYDSPIAIDLDVPSGKMYWADMARDQIFRANLNGSNAEVLVDMGSLANGSAITGLALDLRNGKMYWSDLQTTSFYRANLDGSDAARIAESALAIGIAIALPTVSVAPAAGLVTTEAGGAATFKVSLTTPTKADVTIPVQSGDPSEGAVSAASVTFTPANWNVPQTITVTGVDDAMVDGNASYIVMLGPVSSADPDYAGFDPRDVSLTNQDNDLPPDRLYFSLLNTVTVGGVAAANEDILAQNTSGAIRMLFDGSDVGLGALALASFDVIASNQILLSFTTSANIPGVGTVAPADIVLFTASSLGPSTAGTFAMYFDGSDVGLTSGNENLDAVQRLADGRLVISTTGTVSVPGASGAGEDLLVFNPVSLGAATSGTWSMYFDGGDVSLTSTSEKVDAAAVDADGKIYLSTNGNFSVSGVAGANEDVFVFTPTRLGSTTSGSYSSTLFFDGSTLSLSSNDVTGIDIPQMASQSASVLPGAGADSRSEFSLATTAKVAATKRSAPLFPRDTAFDLFNRDRNYIPSLRPAIAGSHDEIELLQFERPAAGNYAALDVAFETEVAGIL